jgi:hypothetical protein
MTSFRIGGRKREAQAATIMPYMGARGGIACGRARFVGPILA